MTIATATVKPADYSVKNVKSLRGREGIGFNSSLYRDGKRVATVDDPANGGPLDWHWLDWKEGKVPVTFKSYQGKEYTRNATPEEAKFVEMLVAEGKDGEFEFEDSFVFGLVEKYEEEKQYRKWCRTMTCFRLKGDEEGTWRTIKYKYDTRIAMHLKQKHGDKLVEILNKRFSK